MRTNITSDIIEELQPRPRRGRPPIVRKCPYCQLAFSATDMRRHQPGCARDHKAVPPQPLTMPDDLENQQLSPNPLERLRQLDQQEQDRIERS